MTLGPDGRTLAVAGSLVVPNREGGSVSISGTSLLRIWRIDGTSEFRLTSYTADTPEGKE